MKLLIVESPAKAKTINKYLGKDFKVVASKGHIKDLPIKELGVDLKDFEMKIVPMKGKESHLKDLKKLMKEADVIYLATDPDREGEAISFHLKEDAPKGKEIHRVLFNAITKDKILEAVKNPEELNENTYNAQKTRRVLDRLVGYKISPILNNKIAKGASAGRVQSVALRLIIDREKEIEDFVADNWFEIEAYHNKEKNFTSNYFGKDKETKITLEDKTEVDKILQDIKGKDFSVDEIIRKERLKSPTAPFTTSKMQQEASKKLKFSAKKTMEVAQRLYEGINGLEGLITYMRTDSVRTDEDALKSLRGYIEEEYGKENLPKETIIYKTKGDSQDAHEAIRPTSLENTPKNIKGKIGLDEYKLYKMIWDKFISSQMKEALYNDTIVFLKVENHIFKTKGSVLIERGFLNVYKESSDEKSVKKGQEEKSQELPELNEKEVVPQFKEAEIKEKKSTPPPLYTEATLVKELEKKGIGRPSTFAAIIQNLLYRSYVEIIDKKFNSTDLGKLICKTLVENFKREMDYKFTAKMEKSLDEIEKGIADYKDVLKEFWQDLEKTIEKADKNIKQLREKSKRKTTEHSCEKENCDGKYILAKRKKDKKDIFMCENYNTCKSAFLVKILKSGKYKKVDDNKYHKEPCDKCGSKMKLIKGSKGKFWACSGYPKCNNTRDLTLGIVCDKCNKGEFISRKSKKTGKLFYPCNNKDCDNISWDKPVKPKKEEKSKKKD
tara:strand:+ start:3439 stop:5610 length:2172 start_codon:yes stop_codon:yes gene_type:complete